MSGTRDWASDPRPDPNAMYAAHNEVSKRITFDRRGMPILNLEGCDNLTPEAEAYIAGFQRAIVVIQDHADIIDPETDVVYSEGWWWNFRAMLEAAAIVIFILWALTKLGLYGGF